MHQANRVVTIFAPAVIGLFLVELLICPGAILSRPEPLLLEAEEQFSRQEGETFNFRDDIMYGGYPPTDVAVFAIKAYITQQALSSQGNNISQNESKRRVVFTKANPSTGPPKA